MVVSTALLCLSINIFMEARSESIMGQYAVALVTMNRAKWQKSEVCSTVFQKNQFSWANGKATKVKGGWHIRVNHPLKLKSGTEVDAWERSKTIAKAVLDGRMYDFTRGANHYHADYVKPPWAARMTKVKTVGRHIFYRREA